MIEDVSNSNIDEVLPLIKAYQAFYRVAEISEIRNRDFFSQFGVTNPEGCQFLFRQEGVAVAFATLYFTYTSTIAAKVAVLADLYTLPEYRGRGIARQLIEHCREFAATRGAVRLQWVTAPDNERAQGLYDSLGTGKSDWCVYTYGV